MKKISLIGLIVILMLAISGCTEDLPENSCGPVPPSSPLPKNSSAKPCASQYMLDKVQVELLDPQKTILPKTQTEEKAFEYLQEKDFVQLL